MLSIKSYGCLSPKPTRNIRVLPSIQPFESHPPPFVVARMSMLPLYRTSNGFDYGKYVEISDEQLLVLENVRKTIVHDFSKGFIAGAYVDTSIGSIEKKKQLAKKNFATKLAKNAIVQVQHESKVKELERKMKRNHLNKKMKQLELQLREKGCIKIQSTFRGYCQRKLNRRNDLDKLSSTSSNTFC